MLLIYVKSAVNGRGSSHSSNGRWPSLTSSTPQSMAFSGDGARSMTTGRPLDRMRASHGWVEWGQWAVTIDGQKGLIILKMDMNNHSSDLGIRVYSNTSMIIYHVLLYYFDLPRGGISTELPVPVNKRGWLEVSLMGRESMCWIASGCEISMIWDESMVGSSTVPGATTLRHSAPHWVCHGSADPSIAWVLEVWFAPFCT